MLYSYIGLPTRAIKQCAYFYKKEKERRKKSKEGMTEMKEIYGDRHL